jgi:hypothetical protein
LGVEYADTLALASRMARQRYGHAEIKVYIPGAPVGENEKLPAQG